MRKILIFLFIFNYILALFAQSSTQPIEEKVKKLMPPNTELLWSKVDSSQDLLKVVENKFGTFSSKEKIVEFYRLMFTNEGFTELKSYSLRESKQPFQFAYFFSKPNKLIILNILKEPEYGLNIYYISFYEPDFEAIKNFDIKGEPQ